MAPAWELFLWSASQLLHIEVQMGPWRLRRNIRGNHKHPMLNKFIAAKQWSSRWMARGCFDVFFSPRIEWSARFSRETVFVCRLIKLFAACTLRKKASFSLVYIYRYIYNGEAWRIFVSCFLRFDRITSTFGRQKIKERKKLDTRSSPSENFAEEVKANKVIEKVSFFVQKTNI